jgi:hypothetical protein
LAKQGYNQTDGYEDSIHYRATEHYLRAENQSPGGEYQREKGVAVAEKKIADGDVPGVQFEHRPLILVVEAIGNFTAEAAGRF